MRRFARAGVRAPLLTVHGDALGWRCLRTSCCAAQLTWRQAELALERTVERRQVVEAQAKSNVGDRTMSVRSAGQRRVAFLQPSLQHMPGEAHPGRLEQQVQTA